MSAAGRIHSAPSGSQFSYPAPRSLVYPMPVVSPASLPSSARTSLTDQSSFRAQPGVSSPRMPRFLANEVTGARSTPITPVRSRVETKDSAPRELFATAAPILQSVGATSSRCSPTVARPARVLKQDAQPSSVSYPLPVNAHPLERSARQSLDRSARQISAANSQHLTSTPPQAAPLALAASIVAASRPPPLRPTNAIGRPASTSFPMPTKAKADLRTTSGRPVSARPLSSSTPSAPLILSTPQKVLSATPRTVSTSDRTLKAEPAPWRLKLGAEVPNFDCTTTAGNFMFHDFISGGPEFTLLFSHPADFTPVCTTELGRCETLISEFEARGVQLIGLSCDPLEAHVAWSADILGREQICKADGKLSFPLIADANRKIAGSLGMLDPEELDSHGIPLPARTLMVIDKRKKVKLAIVYPATTGRSFDEVLRAIDSLILTKERSLATPVDWRQGERCIVAPSVSTAQAEKMFDDLVVEDLLSGKPYLRHVSCPPTGKDAIANGSVRSQEIRAGVGISSKVDTRDAVLDAIQNALQDVCNPAMVFASCTVDRVVEEVQAAFADFLPGVPIHGITSSQSILHPTGSYAKGVGCLIIDAPPGSFACAFADDAAEAANLLHEQMPTVQAIIMSTVPGSEESAIQTLIESFGAPIYGGTAADNELNGSWQVFGSDRCSKVGISLVGIGPGVRLGASMIGPYLPTSRRAVISKGEGRRAYEIDNMPAADWVYQWLGASVEDAYVNGGLILSQTALSPIGFPLPSGNYQSAHLAALGGPEKWVDFFAPIVEGQEIVIMDAGDGPETGYAQTFTDAYQLAAMNGQLSKPKAGVLIFCGGMAMAVGDRLNYGLVNGLQSALDVPILGMTCFGEQTYAPDDNVNLHSNLSLGLLLFE